MRSRLVRAQLVVFAIVSVVAVTYAGYYYAGVQRLTGIGTYTVTAHLEEAGGLYPSALVTFRGVDVGVVTSITAVTTGADARLQIKSDHKVPADATAYVRSVSVAGEQFIDLVPDTGLGAKLVDGSSIAQGKTNVPVPAGEVIKKVYGLLNSLPKKSLATVLDETSTALDGTGEQLNQALEASTSLVASATKNTTATNKLVDDLEPVLDNLVTAGPNISTFSANLNSFTQQLTMSDASIQTALQTGAPFFDSVSSLAQQITPTVPVLLANLQTVGEVLRVNVPGIRHVLTVYPAFTSAINASYKDFVLPSDRTSGQAELDIKFGNTQNPVPCTEGYQRNQRRNPGDVSQTSTPAGQHCELPNDDFRVVRGARNSPCEANPDIRTADLAECPGGKPSTWPEVLSRPGVGYQPPAAGSSMPSATTSTTTTANREVTAVPYDPTTGKFQIPGQPTTYTLGSIVGQKLSQKEVMTSWEDLFPH